ncbi:MAG: prolipoprotein diacylglyceryl transferase [Firmicutes bacterium]|nr:prolipoprotein diacylglyceryl transferase [Bacillota bacterium]MBO2522009.1 prolipoprotein diacylglyceryl transferase [Bacillota bacterium]
MAAGIDPVIVEIGPFAIRWYGVLMAVSIAWGFYYLRRDGMKLGYGEDFLYNAAALAVAGGIAGARLVYVATNWESYAASPLSILRVDQGGLSFHGAMAGGGLALGLYLKRKGYSLEELLDLVVPGICIGIALVRIGNLINGEVLGRPTGLDGWFDRHPAQLIGSSIGLVLLVVHNVLARRRPPAGYLFWSFVLYYSLLRGIVEETVRENPLYAWGYVNETWGIGFFTLTHLVTPLFVALGWAMRRRALALDRRPRGPRVPEGGRRP